MNTYRVTLRHDNGRVQFVTTATSQQAAVVQVCDAEGAPHRAVVKIEDFGPVSA